MEWFCYSRSDDWNTQCPKNNRINSTDLIVFINCQLKNYAVHAFVRYIARQKRPTNSSKALIYGAGASGRELNAAIATNSEIEVVAFLDDSLNNQGQILDGKIVYSPSNLRGLVEKFSIQQVLLAMPSVSRARRNKIIQSVKQESL